jgi:hypothetical protein
VMQVRQGRVNFTTLAELLEGAPIMTGTFSINYKPVIICVARQAKRSNMISTPGGKIGSNQLIRCVPI